MLIFLFPVSNCTNMQQMSLVHGKFVDVRECICLKRMHVQSYHSPKVGVKKGGGGGLALL